MNDDVTTSTQEAGGGASGDTATAPIPPRKGALNRLYWWILSWADTPYGAPALFILAMAESSFFPIPPDPLLVALAVGKPARALYYSALCTIGSVIGGVIGYGIGYFFIESVGMRIIEFYGVSAKYATIQKLYEEHNAIVVLVAGVTPIPYKVFTIAGGAFQVSFITFVLASIAGRGFRFFLEGVLLYYYGEKIRDFIDKYMTWLSWIFGILLVGGFVAIKYLAG
ncbi:MAG: VTT domain-containing protein [Nitrospinota bacterium]|nr:VTT domain-containing protein [Nitrospinota bacterium]MDH5755762.1 VTT domain-containing protein [Nitrospinota bacterium]